MKVKIDKKPAINLVVFITLLAAALRFFHLNYYSFWGDEVLFIDLSKSVSLFKTAMPYHLPLAPFLIKLAISLFNQSEFIVRAPFAIFGVLSVFVLYLVGKKLFNERVGILAAFLLTISVYAIGQAQDAKPYSLIIFFSTLTVYFLFSLIDKKPTLKTIVFFLIAAFLTLYSGYIGFFPLFIFGLFLSLIFLGRQIFNFEGRRVELPPKAIVVIVTTIIFLPVLFVIFSPLSAVIGRLHLEVVPPGDIFNASRMNIPRGVITAFSNHFWLYLFFFFWALPSLFTKRRKSASRFFLVLWIIAFMAYFFVFDIGLAMISEFGDFERSRPEYYVYYLPVYLLLVALGIDEFSLQLGSIIWRCFTNIKKELLVKILTISVVLVFLYFTAAPLRNYYFELRGWQADWRSVSEYLETKVLPEDAFVRGIREDRDTNYVSPYFDFQNYEVDYTIFPLKEKKNNWYVSYAFDFPEFEDWTVSFSAHPSRRSYAHRVFKLAYIGQGNEVIKVINRRLWSMKASLNEELLGNLADDDKKTCWTSIESVKRGDYLQIDIRENKLLTRISLDSPRPYHIKDYLIQTSLDGVSWENVQSGFTSQGPYFYYYSQIPFEPIEARLIRIVSLGNDRREWTVSEINLYEVRKREVANSYNGPTKFTGLVVSDPETRNGYAKFVPQYSPLEFRLFQYGERFTLPAGSYRAKFRIKTDDNKIEDNLGNVTNLMIDVGFEKVGAYLPKPLRIRAKDFVEANRYQEFYLDFSHDGKGHVVFRIRNYGKNNYWFDYPEIERAK